MLIICSKSNQVARLFSLIDPPADQTFDAPLHRDLRHCVASVIQLSPILLVESLTERMPDGSVVARVHPPADVLRGVRGGPGRAGEGARPAGIDPTGLDGDSDDALLLLPAAVRQVEPQVLLGLSRGRLAVRLEYNK